ncbi:bactofilin family protein [Halorarius halobius]|uniref:bactofilin family protein n=1 Tax=Halorarius halobius TaxID=2962671 RepID=UPI0020CFD304|nr:polymer-forming cytoskeletal protein [Halorarius halobius]
MLSPRRRVAVLAALVLLVASFAGTAAADPRFGGSIVVPEGQTVGDVEAVGGSVVVRGTVDGDLSGVAGSVVVYGTVTGNVELAAGSVTLADTGTVEGDVQVAAGSLVVDGTVLGSVTAGAGDIVLGPDARIAGDLRYDPDAALSGNRGAVEGSIVADDAIVGDVSVVPEVPGVVFDVWGLVVGLVVGAVLLYGAPRFSDRVTDRAVGEPLASGGVGLFLVVVAPVVALLLVVTIVGIPLALVGAVLFGLFAWLGSLYGRLAVGAWLADALGQEGRAATLLLGFGAVFVVGLVPVLGGLVELLVALLGIGALAVVANGWRQRDASEGEGPTPAIRPV